MSERQAAVTFNLVWTGFITGSPLQNKAYSYMPDKANIFFLNVIVFMSATQSLFFFFFFFTTLTLFYDREIAKY